MQTKKTLLLFTALFAAYILYLTAESATFMPNRGVKTAAAPVERTALLTGGDDEGYEARELLPTEKININSASAQQLQRLPGIGPALSEAILEYRSAKGDFSCIEDIMKVEGIGEGRFADIAQNITVEEIKHENSGS